MTNPVLEAGYGIILIVIFVACILSGIVCSQVFNYYTRFPNDRLGLKLYVGIILLLNVLSTVSACAWQFQLAIIHWGESKALQDQTSPFFALSPFFCGIMGFLVHLFFARRIHVISGSKWQTGLILLFALCAVAGALGTTIVALLQIDYARFKKLPFGQMWLAGSVISDLIITSALTYNLRKRRGDFQNTNHILDNIVRLTVSNGLLTSLTSLTDLVLYAVYGKPTRTVSFMIPALYAITILSSLNARRVEAEPTESWPMSSDGTRTNNTNQQSTRPSQIRAWSGINPVGSLQFSRTPPTFPITVEVKSEHEIGDESDRLHVRPISSGTALTGVMGSGWRADSKSCLDIR